MSDPSFKVGTVKLDDCILVNHKNKQLDIRDLMLEFNIYQNIMKPGTECEIVLLDSNGLVEFFPIVGDETLILKFTETGSINKELIYLFRVYKISDRRKMKQGMEVFVLKCITQELINNARFSVDKSYNDQPISNIVKSIYDEYLKPNTTDFAYIKKDNEIVAENTLGNFSVIFNKKRPLDAISYLTNEAEADFNSIQYTAIGDEDVDSNVSASSFVIFQKNNNWSFQTLQSLFNGNPVDDFYMKIAASEMPQPVPLPSSPTPIRPYQIISSFSIKKQFDMSESLNTGKFNLTVFTVDPISRQYTSDNFVYDRDVNKLGSIERNISKIYTKESLYANQSDTNNIDTDSAVRRFSLASRLGSSEYLRNGIDTDPQIRNPRTLHSFLKYDYASRMHLANIVFEVIIPGNISIELGDIINLHIPQTTNTLEYSKKINIFYDKRFMVSAIRYTFNKETNHFFTVLECVKNSYARTPEEVTK